MKGKRYIILVVALAAALLVTANVTFAAQIECGQGDCERGLSFFPVSNAAQTRYDDLWVSLWSSADDPQISTAGVAIPKESAGEKNPFQTMGSLTMGLFLITLGIAFNHLFGRKLRSRT